MPVYEREVVVDAPFEDVWKFHSGASGLEALTPDWMNLRVESSVGPDGDPDPDVLEAGSRVESTVAPFGVAPRQRWVSAIVAREEGDGQAFFRDEMRAGPFPEWVHTHSFEAVDGGTRVHDHVEYELPVVRGLFGPLGWVGFEPMFRYRHRKTKELLEG
ncbi:SRPBCC family protein [Halosimplex pelagicum]|uniref:SRPBCC family protein n=1 Tax=Halosimplex pelagicum TaxID=869886 RepID=A0A7D5SVY5_9EURY|nr:SRPBCC family protein [Halosimplex pelagicum]QLH82667.1 SRPBCC family protein [Halosimplex pelagicum]